MFTVRYGKTIASSVALAVAALLVTLVLTHTGPAKPRPAPRPQGTTGIAEVPNEVDREGIKPGNYATAINIHNPSFGEGVTIWKRAVQAPPELAQPLQIPPSQFQSYPLGPGYAVEVDCTDIAGLLGSPSYVFEGSTNTFIKGFVTIVSRSQLDVVGVYSAEPPTVTASPLTIPGIGLEMLPILPRMEFVPSSTTATGVVAGPSGRNYVYSAKFLCGEAVHSVLTP